MKKILLFVLGIICFSKTTQSQTPTWNAIGTSDFDQATCSSATRAQSDLVLSPNGTPYIAFEDWANYQRLSIRKYNGTTWEYVGSPALSVGFIYNPRLAFDNTGTPHVVYSDANNALKLTVIKFNGTNWVTVGVAGFSTSNAGGAAITIDANNNIYVGYYDSNLSKMAVHKYNGTSWATVGTTTTQALGGNAKDIGVDANGIIYLLYGKVIAKYDGTNWTNLPHVNTASSYLTMTMDNTGKPYVAFDTMTPTLTSMVRCLFYNGTNWVNSASGTVISKPSSNFAFSYTRVHFGKDNKPYVGFGETVNGAYVPRLYVNNGPAWTSVPTSTVYPMKVLTNYPYVAVDNASKAYFGTSQASYNSGALIYTYSSNTWSLLGVKDATDGQRGRQLSMDIAPNGTPYIAEIIADNAVGSLAVRKFNGVKWDSVGITNFQYAFNINFSNSASSPKIKISSNGTPYIGYTYGFTSFTADVRKFNGTAWVKLTNTVSPIATGVSSKIDLDFLPNDTLIAMVLSPNLEPSVYKFNGTTWAALSGTINLPINTSTGSQDLAVSPTGIPYIAYVRAGASTSTLTGLHVKKYIGGTWQTVGTGTVAVGAATDVTLKFDASGTPFVAFQCDNGLPSGRKANVMKYNGTNWVSVGNPNFSPSTADLLKMELDNTGNPTVIFQIDGNTSINGLNASKVTAMKFNGTAWASVGGVSHSASNVTELELVKNPSTGVITEAYMSLVPTPAGPSQLLAGLIWVKELGVGATGINENSIANNKQWQVKVYPNPSHSSINIESEVLANGETSIQLVNTLGQVVLSEKTNASAANLSIEHLQEGIYILSLQNNKGQKATYKLIKN
jgi:hypothetical protein